MAQRRRGLGRGLDALLSEGPVESAAAPAASAPPVALPIDALAPNPRQPRSRFDEAALTELADSIRAQGIIQPIVVRPADPGSAERYQIVAGERRWRAARLAGLEQVPVVVRTEELDDQATLLLALVENLQRSDLDPIEEAEAYRELREGFGLSQEEIASRVGKSRSAVANQLRLLKLPEEVVASLRAGSLSAGQVRPLLALPKPSQQVELAARIEKESLSAREVERLVQERAGDAGPKPTRSTGKPTVDVHTRKAGERLTRALQTRVEIRRRGKGGQVRIHFHSEEELMRIFERLTHGKESTGVQE
ncbi:MAG: ParB/RepB/Spo0J family partition protein [Acidobacteria bacterium]|nr:MAG: ParB/RepB/Spo0J family partition protein [Acidobacteriota bacterium]REJ99610.1 MAG: ParB/RepB/Spo0J family partition protein [Acidobacteriota bacterium]